MAEEDQVFSPITDSEEERNGSVFYVDCFGEIHFGGGSPYDGWRDSLNTDQVKDLFNFLKAYYD